MSSRLIKIIFSGDTKGLVKAAATGKKSLSGLQTAVNRSAAVIVAAGAAAAVGLVKLGSDFQAAYNTIRVGTGATGAALDGLKDSFKRVAGSVGADMGHTAQTLADLNTLTGQSGKGLEDLTRTFLQLERITGKSIGIDKVTRVFGDWSVATGDQIKVMDHLFKVSQSTGIGVEELADSVVQFGAPLRGLGFTLAETSALFGKWHKEGVNTSTVMAGLRVATSKWAKDARDPAKALQETITKMQSMTDRAKVTELAIKTFGARAGPDMAAAILEGRFALESLLGPLEASGETIATAAKQTETFQGKLARLKNQGFVALEPIAMRALSVMESGVGTLKRLTEWADKNRGAVKAMAIVLATLASAILVAKAGMVTYSTVQAVHLGLTASSAAATKGHAAATVLFAAKMAIIKTATAAWTAVQWLLNIALTANPIGLIIVAIAALIAIIVLIATKTTWFQTAWKWAWSGIKAGALAVGRWFRDTLWEKWIKGSFLAMNKLIRSAIVWFLDLRQGIINRLKGIAEAISAPFRAGFNAVARAWNNTVGRLSWSVPAWVPVIGGKTISAPQLPTFHRGGIIGGASGQEVPVLARAGEGIFTREQMAALGDMAGGTNVTVIVEIDGQQLEGRIKRVVDDGARTLRRRVLAGAGAR